MDRVLFVAQSSDRGASRPPFSDSWDLRVEPIRIFQTVSEGEFSEVQACRSRAMSPSPPSSLSLGLGHYQSPSLT